MKMAELNVDDVTVRRATHADCDGIKGIIRDLHGGNDRFLNNFHQDVNLGTTFPYVAENAGQIFAYTCGQIIEDGELMLMRYGRVSERYRGKSVITQLYSAIFQEAFTKFPNLQRLTWTSGSESVSKMTIERHPYMKLVLHMPTEIFEIHTNTLKALCETDLFHELEKKYAIDAVTAVPKREALRLLTEEIRFLDYAPIRPLIGWQPSGWHRTTLAADLQVTDLFITRSSGSESSRIEAFSFVTTKRNDKGVGIDIMVHCAVCNSSTDLVIAYLLHSICEIATMYSDTNIVYSFCFPTHIDQNVVLNVLSGKLGIPSNVDGDTTANMLEYKLSDAAEMKSML